MLLDRDGLEQFAAALARQLRPGDVIALSGPLGAGKTTLARGVLNALGHDGEVPSPTFTLVQAYDAPSLRLPVWHADLYRLAAAGEVEELGLDEILAAGVLLLEWPERLGDRLWPETLQIRLDPEMDERRCLTVRVPPGWEERWPPT
jgi:tRNA threonylcarbamoyladenosine biosynthesis protein TsaE